MVAELQKKVYKIVFQIPKGSTLSYKEVAEKAGKPRAYRAVGNILANHKIKGLPCHRVIRSDGSIGGFKGSYQKSKEKKALLEKEGAF